MGNDVVLVDLSDLGSEPSITICARHIVTEAVAKVTVPFSASPLMESGSVKFDGEK